MGRRGGGNSYAWMGRRERTEELEDLKVRAQEERKTSRKKKERQEREGKDSRREKEEWAPCGCMCSHQDPKCIDPRTLVLRSQTEVGACLPRPLRYRVGGRGRRRIPLLFWPGVGEDERDKISLCGREEVVRSHPLRGLPGCSSAAVGKAGCHD